MPSSPNDMYVISESPSPYDEGQRNKSSALSEEKSKDSTDTEKAISKLRDEMFENPAGISIS